MQNTDLHDRRKDRDSGGEHHLQKQRKRRFEKIQKMVSLEQEFPREKLIAELQVTMGLSEESAREYVEKLVATGRLIDDGGILRPGGDE